MTTYYTIEMSYKTLAFKLTYRGGKFLKIEKTKGSITPQELEHIGRLIPPTINEVAAFAKAKLDKATYTEVKKVKSEFAQFNAAWFSFYSKTVGVPPKFNGTDGKHLKGIMNYLQSISSTPQEALVLWRGLLDHWHLLSDFHKQHTELSYINSKLNTLLNALKNTTKDNESVFQEAVNSPTGEGFTFK